MEITVNELKLSRTELQKLLGYRNGDAALLLLYLKCGNPMDSAGEALALPEARLCAAKAALSQLGLWQEETERILREDSRPRYSEQDVLDAQSHDRDFIALRGEVQRNLGRMLNVEELKILLGILRYLGLPPEVVSLLISHCKEKNRRRGNNRNPSMRMIEQEAYAWADKGADNLDAAVAVVREDSLRADGIAQIKRTLQIYDRSLTPGEEKYAAAWLDMGFDQEALALAYEKTCVNTGGLKWPYMNKILQSWHSQGLHTGQAVRTGDRKQSPQKPQQRELDQAEKEAIDRLLRESAGR